MFISDPDFYPSRIPDLGSRVPDPTTLFYSKKFHKIENYFIFNGCPYAENIFTIKNSFTAYESIFLHK
jgi:hypothetical protein